MRLSLDMIHHASWFNLDSTKLIINTLSTNGNAVRENTVRLMFRNFRHVSGAICSMIKELRTRESKLETCSRLR